jgi:3'-phosphoadenosine 5'-phosphosulfate (PAPS) 3'-phosphatase
MLVAQGSADLMVDCGLQPWDAAAPRAIVEEAGGTFTDWQGRPTRYDPDVLASNRLLHEALLSVLSPSAVRPVANGPTSVNNNLRPSGPRPADPA